MTKRQLFICLLVLPLIAASGGIYFLYTDWQAQQVSEAQAQECDSCTRRHKSMTRAIEARNQKMISQNSSKNSD